MPTVSVVLPVFNGAPPINDAVQGILDQTLSNVSDRAGKLNIYDYLILHGFQEGKNYYIMA